MALIDNRVALRWAAGITFSLVVSTVASVHEWQFYAIMFLFWLTDRQTWRQGIEHGVVIGVSMDAAERRKLQKIINDEAKEEDEE